MRRALTFGLLVILAMAAATFVWRDPAPVIAVRAVPHQMQFGRVFPGFPVGAEFVTRGGVESVEVALVDLGGERTPFEFTLRHARGGEVLRRVVIPAEALPSGDGWVRIELGVAPSGDKQDSFAFELASAVPSSHSPWVRYRGVSHVVRPWGDRVLPGGELEFELAQLPHANLQGLALAVDGLDAAAFPARVVLTDPRSGEVVRRGEVVQRSPQATAWALFTFEPLADSRWKPWNVRFELPPDARPIGSEDGPSLIALFAHGWREVGPTALSCGETTFADRDLFVRVFAAHDIRASVPAASLARGGSRLLLAALLSVAAAAAVARLVAVGAPRRRRG